MTEDPARLFGLKERGRITDGFHADLVLIDSETVGAGEIVARAGLPGDSSRLFADATGVKRVFVNGTAIVMDGRPTTATPGSVLRAGRDTACAGARMAKDARGEAKEG